MTDEPLDAPLDAPLDVVPAAPPAPQEDSLRARLQANLARKQARTTEKFRIPGYSGDGVELLAELSVKVGYREQRESFTAHQGLDEADLELNVGADMLIAACVSVWARVDGEETNLNMKLGLPLAMYLGLEGAENDRQALFLIIPDGAELMQLVAAHGVWRSGASGKAEESLLGEYVAASPGR